MHLERGAAEGATAVCETAVAHYDAAVRLYRQHLALSGDGPTTYEVRMNLADALFWSERYAEAAPIYARVRDDRTQRRFQSQAAHMAVVALERAFDGCVSLRTEPTVAGSPPRARAEPIPHQDREMRAARLAYLALVPRALDAGRRPGYELANAELLYQFGHWPEARSELWAILEQRCTGADAHRVGQVAFSLLDEMALREANRTEREALRSFRERRRCTFDPDMEPPPTHLERRAQCVDGRQQVCSELAAEAASIVWRATERRWEAERLARSDDPRAPLRFEEAANDLIEALELDPRHPRRPVVLQAAAEAYVHAGRIDRALGALGRLVRAPGFPDQPAIRDRMLAAALARHGELSERVFDWSAAGGSYGRALSEPRLVASTDPVVQRHMATIRRQASELRDALRSLAAAEPRR